MTVIPLLVLCSLALAAFGVMLFVYSVRQHDHEHADRLSLLPLEDDLPPQPGRSREVKETGAPAVPASVAPSPDRSNPHPDPEAAS